MGKALLVVGCWYIDNIWCPYQRMRTKIRVIKYHLKYSSFVEKLKRFAYRFWMHRKIQILNAKAK